MFQTDDTEFAEHHDNAARQGYLRTAIVREHLALIAQKHPEAADGLSYASAISLLRDVQDASERGEHDEDSTDSDAIRCLPVGLTEDDLKRYGQPTRSLSARAQNDLAAELKRTLLSVLEFWTDEQYATEEERLQRVFQLPEEIHSRRAQIAEHKDALKKHRARVEKLVQDINEIHPRVEDVLEEALKTLPPILDASRAAKADVLAMTIETCLLQLSLVRARAHTALYNHTSSRNPEATLTRALAAAHEKLEAKRRAQEEEEQQLDEQIAVYDRVLSLVDGEGGYTQVIADMARVRTETEECRRDLRRLGWTGD